MTFPKTIDTSSLNGVNGFEITSSSHEFGYAVASTNDINGDGKPDLIVGAPSSNITYVIFGNNNFKSTSDTSNLKSANGFSITSQSSYLGVSTAGVGDINGDGKSDLMVGTWGANVTYVIFGNTNFPITFDTSSLNGANGFNITSPSYEFGFAAAGAGDINGDGKPDLIISSWTMKTAYIIYGNTNFPSTFDTSSLNGINGFNITSFSSEFGFSVAGAGDINGDGKADIIVGAPGTNASYVIFGNTNFPSTLDTSSLNGANGFEITSSSYTFGYAVAGAGDINGDGKLDLIVGAPASNVTYVIFGRTSFPSSIDTSILNGVNGFNITSSLSEFGYSVSGARDINGDGKSDFIVGAPSNNATCVIFGNTNFPSTLATSSLNGANGFNIISSSSQLGYSVADAGDINGDGIDDVVIGAPEFNNDDQDQIYVVFGKGNIENDHHEEQSHALAIGLGIGAGVLAIGIGVVGCLCYKKHISSSYDAAPEEPLS